MKNKNRFTLARGLATALLVFATMFPSGDRAAAQPKPETPKASGKTGGTTAKPVPPSPGPGAKEQVQPAVGSLTIRTKVAGVEVSLNGKLIGKTEAGGVLMIANLPEGTYQVKAHKAGYVGWAREVKVTANTNANVALTMKAVVTNIGDPFRHMRPSDLQQEAEQRQKAPSKDQYLPSADPSLRPSVRPPAAVAPTPTGVIVVPETVPPAKKP